MPKGPAPGWRQLAPHTRECVPYVLAAIAKGHGIWLIWSGIEDRGRARQMRRGLHNAAHMLSKQRERERQPGVSVETDLSGRGPYTIRYRIHDKDQARQLVVAKYGKDRARWPYDPRRRGGKQ